MLISKVGSYVGWFVFIGVIFLGQVSKAIEKPEKYEGKFGVKFGFIGGGSTIECSMMICRTLR